MKDKRTNCQKDAIKHLNMFYAAILLFGFFTALIVISNHLIYPWNLIGTAIGLFFCIPFAVVPFLIYGRFTACVREWAKQSGMKTGNNKNLNLRIICAGMLLIQLAALNLLFPPIIRSIMITACIILIPCNFFWGTESYHTFYNLQQKGGQENNGN